MKCFFNLTDYTRTVFKFLPAFFLTFFLAFFSYEAHCDGYARKLKTTKQKTIKRVQQILYLPKASRQSLFKKRPRFYFQYLEKIFTSKTASDDLKWKALISMTRIDSDKARPYILNSLNSDHWLSQNLGLTALNIIDPKKALLFAVKFIKHSPSLVLKTAAIELIRKRKALRYKPLLWRELHSKTYFRKGKSLWIRQTILKTLFEFSDADDKQKFLALMKDQDPGIQALALKAWKKLSVPNTEPGTAPLLASPEKLFGEAL